MKKTGLFCEGCDRQFQPDEKMLLVYDKDNPELMTAFCVKCLDIDDADETATPDEFEHVAEGNAGTNE